MAQLSFTALYIPIFGELSKSAKSKLKTVKASNKSEAVNLARILTPRGYMLNRVDRKGLFVKKYGKINK
jgi:hypothetical protein